MMNNADRVRSMTDTELASLLSWAYCNGFNNGCNHIYDYDPGYIDWLKQLYEEVT